MVAQIAACRMACSADRVDLPCDAGYRNAVTGLVRVPFFVQPTNCGNRADAVAVRRLRARVTHTLAPRNLRDRMSGRDRLQVRETAYFSPFPRRTLGGAPCAFT